MVDEFGPKSQFVAVGKRNLDYQGINIVTGKYDFAEDHHPEGKLYARVLGAKYAHAKVTSINTSRAEALEGVEAVITFEDHPNWSDTILSVDQQIAAVAAVDEATAERALDLIDVEYQILDAVFDPEDAMRTGAPNAGTFPDGNITPSPSALERGDVAQGFTEADVIVDETVGWLRGHTHNEIEPDSTVAWWEGDNVYFNIGSQWPWGQRNGSASALGMPLNKVHVRCHGTGGAFGNKYWAKIDIEAALLSKKAGKPVGIKLPRRLYTVYGNHQYAVKLHMKLGLKDDGTLTAVETTWWGDGRSNGGRSSWQDPCRHTWVSPNFKKDEWGVANNKPRAGAWRCVAHPEGAFLSDLVLEKAAAQLKMNPLEFRRKIFVSDGMLDQDTGRPMRTPGWGVRQCLEKAATVIGYESKYHAPGTETLPDGRLHGIGIHAHADGHGSGGGGSDSSVLYMLRDGTIMFNSGSTRVMGGPGAQTAIIAETLGMKFEDVRCSDWGNTIASEGGGQFGSRLTVAAGLPVMNAAKDLRAQLFAVAAGDGTDMLNVTPADLDAKDGQIFVKSDPTKFVTHAQVMRVVGGAIIGWGLHPGGNLRKPVGEFEVGSPTVHKSGCAAAAEVAVDPGTGLVEVLSYVNVLDAGRLIDPISAEGQIMAGMPLQINEALYFDDIYDPVTGRLLSFNHIGDKMGTTLDVPVDNDKTDNSCLLETIDAVGPFGAHGIGEPAVSSFVAINNAVNNAIGVDIITGPMTPKVVLQALGKA